MTEPTNKATIYRKLAAIAGEIDAVEKDGRNKDQGYTYATPASVFHALKPIMARHQIAIVPMQIARQDIDTGRTSRSGTPYILTSVDMHYLIVDGESGESIAATWSGVAGAYGDDKGNAKAQTIALRTFLIQLFQIPAEDADADPDARGEAPMRRPQQQRPEPPAPAQLPPPTNGNGHDTPNRATLIRDLSLIATKAREAGHKIAGGNTKGMSEAEIQARIDEIQALLDAPVDDKFFPIGKGKLTEADIPPGE